MTKTRSLAAKLLNQEEVGALPHRSEVCIWWSGGNGPFRYIVAHRNGRTFTLRDLPGGEEHFGSEVEFVGEKPYHTWVWLPSSVAPNGVTGWMVADGKCRGCESRCPVKQADTDDQ